MNHLLFIRFALFLLWNRAYGKFNTNGREIGLYNNVREHVLKVQNSNKYASLIGSAFNWDESSEGVDYWWALHNKWEGRWTWGKVKNYFKK